MKQTYKNKFTKKNIAHVFEKSRIQFNRIVQPDQILYLKPHLQNIRLKLIKEN